jgi:hypothetical protein
LTQLNRKNNKLRTDSLQDAKSDSNRSRVVLSRAVAREIFIVKKIVDWKVLTTPAFGWPINITLAPRRSGIYGEEGRGWMRPSISGATRRKTVLLDGSLVDRRGRRTANPVSRRRFTQPTRLKATLYRMQLVQAGLHPWRLVAASESMHPDLHSGLMQAGHLIQAIIHDPSASGVRFHGRRTQAERIRAGAFCPASGISYKAWGSSLPYPTRCFFPSGSIATSQPEHPEPLRVVGFGFGAGHFLLN